MEEFLRTLIENIVEDKEHISITKTEENKTIKFKVSVSKDDIKRVIGRQGRNARAIRTLMKSVASMEKCRVDVEFVEE